MYRARLDDRDGPGRRGRPLWHLVIRDVLGVRQVGDGQLVGWGSFGRFGISSSEMFSVSGMYTTGSVPGGGAPAGLVRAVKPGRCPTSAPPSRVEGVAVGDEADGEVLLMNSACK